MASGVMRPHQDIFMSGREGEHPNSINLPLEARSDVPGKLRRAGKISKAPPTLLTRVATFSQQPISVLLQHGRRTFSPKSHLAIERIVKFGRGSEINPGIDDYLSDPFCTIANQVTVSV